MKRPAVALVLMALAVTVNSANINSSKSKVVTTTPDPDEAIDQVIENTENRFYPKGKLTNRLSSLKNFDLERAIRSSIPMPSMLSRLLTRPVSDSRKQRAVTDKKSSVNTKCSCQTADFRPYPTLPDRTATKLQSNTSRLALKM